MKDQKDDFGDIKNKAINELLEMCVLVEDEAPFLEHLIKDIRNSKNLEDYNKILLSYNFSSSIIQAKLKDQQKNQGAKQDNRAEFTSDNLDTYLYLVNQGKKILSKIQTKETQEAQVRSRDEKKLQKHKEIKEQQEKALEKKLEHEKKQRERREFEKKQRLEIKLAEEAKKAEAQKELKQKQDEEKAKNEEIEKQAKIQEIKNKEEKLLAKEQRRIEFLRKQEAEKILEEQRQKELKEQQKLEVEDKKQQEIFKIQQQEFQRQKNLQDALIIKDNIIAKTSANFEKFQSFFDFLRKKEYLDIGEFGLFGSRVYKEIISENHRSSQFAENKSADFDFFCIPSSQDSRGIFIISPDDLAAKINFQDLLDEFNKENPNLRIDFLPEDRGRKNVNHGGKIDSLNFKLVATFFEDKIDGEKSEKIIKDRCEFDLNFYTQQSILQNLQWQLNLERLLLFQAKDGSFDLKINHCNCDLDQKITTQEFIANSLSTELPNFLTKYNPYAKGFIKKIINEKGYCKYLNAEIVEQTKIELVEEFSDTLKRELINYKNFMSQKIDEGDEIGKAKKIEYESIIKGVEQDHILSKIIEKSSTAISQTTYSKVADKGLVR